MKKYYSVTFKHSEDVYCSNIAHAGCVEAVENHYSKYEWVNVKECDDCDVETARRKGMPIVEIETEEENLINMLVEIGKDNTSCVYSFITGRISAITKGNHTAEEKVQEIQMSLQCMYEALKEIAKVREGV